MLDCTQQGLTLVEQVSLAAEFGQRCGPHPVSEGSFVVVVSF